MQAPIPLEIFSASKIHTSDDFQLLSNSKLSSGKNSNVRCPFIIRGAELGPCVTKWSTEYLLTKDKNKKVKVHKSKSPQLDFRKKNFSYETITFGQLVSYCSNSHRRSVEGSGAELQEDRPESYFWYLRSLGNDPRGKDISDLSIHFPQLAKDLKIPPYFPQELFFSSVFRISSPLLQLWTHYDTCNNILIQIKGRKRIIFFPPKEALNLYLDGDKSEVLDVQGAKVDLEKYPKLKGVQSYEALLEEGDIVFIPALWFHNVTALDFSISVNVFWKNLGVDFYDKKDTYGNRDLIPAQLAFKTFEKATTQLKVLPQEYEDFYLRRMIISIQKRLEVLNKETDTEIED